MKKILYFLVFLTSCTSSESNIVNGYVEGEYVYVSPTTGGILDRIYVSKGQQIVKGEKLFSLDEEIWQTTLDKAKNEVEQVQRQLEQAQAVLTNAEKEFKRAQKLLQSNTVSQANYDSKATAYDKAKAEYKETETRVVIAKRNVDLLRRQYHQSSVVSSCSGIINDVYFRSGEFVAQGKPVVSILPPENIKVRFYVSEKLLPSIHYQQTISVSCDACLREYLAKVTYISPEAEYTPPVIYSTESREKLVFMIEAVFEDLKDVLSPGLPISVRINE